MRAFLATILFAMGLTVVLGVFGGLIAHAAYASPLSPAGAAKAGSAGVVLLLLGWWLAPVRIPTVVVLFLLVSFAGINAVGLALKHTGFTHWTSVDLVLVAAGSAWIGGAVLWLKRWSALAGSESSFSRRCANSAAHPTGAQNDRRNERRGRARG